MRPVAPETRRIFLHSAGFVAARAATGGLSVLASLLLYRILRPEEAGRFQFLLAGGMTLGVLCGLGFHDTLARFIPERPDGQSGGLFRRALRRILVFGPALGAIVYVAIRATGFPLDAARAGLLLPAFVLVYALYTCALGMLRGQGKLKILSLLDLGWNFGAKAAAVAVALALPEFVPAFAAYAGLDLLVVLVAFWLLRGQLRGPAPPLDREVVGFARLVLLAELVRILCSTVDVYVVRGLLGAEPTGLFTAGVRMTTIVEQLVLTPIGVPLLYYFSRPGSEDLRRTVVENGTRLLGALMGAGALLLAATAGPIVRLLLGADYEGSVPIARIYTGHAVGASLLVLLIPLYNSKNRPAYAIAQSLAVLGVNLVLDLALVPRMGIRGAAIAGVAATGTSALLFAGIARARFQVDARGGVLRVLSLYFVCYGVLAVGWTVPALALYAIGLWALRLIRRRDIELIRRRPRAQGSAPAS